MSNLLTDVIKNIGEDNLELLVNKFGIEKKKDEVIRKAGSAILGGLAKNAKRGQSKEIIRVLKEDHFDSVEKTQDILEKKIDKKGERILEHVWGNKKNKISKKILKDTGLYEKNGLKVLADLAPLILGGLSKTTEKTKMDSKVLTDVLDMATKGDLKNDEFSFLKILDLDKDGEIADDIPKIWEIILSILSFFGLKKKK